MLPMVKYALALLIPSALLVSATDFYISSDGSDKNAGDSADTAFQTFAKAQDTVRTLLKDSISEDVNVHVAPGIYNLSEPLRFTAEDSGKSGFTVKWIGDNVTISGGLEVTGWVVGDDGVYSAVVPAGTESRNLYVGGQAANYARRKLDDRTEFTYTSTGISWSNSKYDWLMSTTGIANAEIRFINSFTDRYAPIADVGNQQLVMRQPAWANQIIGYDTAADPFADFGVFVQNCRALLTDGGEFYLDSEEATVYYKPLDGEDMSTVDTYLGIQETLISISGSYDDPAHDISFQGLALAHSTWLRPSQGYGYVDQQTGGYIGENVTYPEFEATRPQWWQMPSAVQISAAGNINISTCSFTQLGAGGVGIGNDANAHLSEVGLGARNISIVNGYFTQVMGNSITAGGIQADAHHPSDPQMVNTNITISGNIFYNNSALFSSTVNILFTYVQYSTISHNDIYIAPYSGICHGYGWGSNDAGGSPEYRNRGLYKYQDEYATPTTMKNNLIDGNLIHGYGLSHTDLGALYTLSRAPGTLLTNNYAYDSSWYGLYPDEGSSNMTYINNECFSQGGWYSPNDWSETTNTGNNTLIDNWGKVGDTQDGFPDHTGRRDNTFLRNFVVGEVASTSAEAQKAAYRAGILPGVRLGRPVSNDNDMTDGFLSLGTAVNGSLAVNVTNFDDVDLASVSFQVSADNAEVEPISLPQSIPANSFSIATYRVTGSSQPSVSATVNYENPRTGQARELVANAVVPLG